MSKENIYIHDQTFEFLKSVLTDPTDPISRLGSENPRQLAIAGAYLTSPASLRDLEEIYGMTYEGIRQNLIRFIQDLHALSSRKTQLQFPLETITLKKPPSFEKHIFQSHRKHGKSADVALLLKEGTSFDDAARQLSLTPHQRISVRHSVKKWGFDIPSKSHPLQSSFPDLYKELTQSTDPIRIQTILDQLTIRYFLKMAHPSNGQEPFLIPLKTIVPEIASYRSNAKLICARLKELGIPVGITHSQSNSRPLNYYFIPISFLKTAQQALISDELLSRLPRHEPEN